LSTALRNYLQLNVQIERLIISKYIYTTGRQKETTELYYYIWSRIQNHYESQFLLVKP